MLIYQLNQNAGFLFINYKLQNGIAILITYSTQEFSH